MKIAVAGGTGLVGRMVVDAVIDTTNLGTQKRAEAEAFFGGVTRTLLAAEAEAPELAGPERLQMVDLARRLSKARSLGRRVVPVRLPGAAGKAMRSGALVPTAEGPRGPTTFIEWLAEP